MEEALAKNFASVSVHGLANSAGAKRLWSRVLWMLLFIAASAGFIFHLSLLVGRFRDRPINTQLSLEAADFRFPSLVVCNPFPLSNSLYNYVLRNMTSAERKQLNHLPNSVEVHMQSTIGIVRQLAAEEKDVLGLGQQIGELSLHGLLTWSSLSSVNPHHQPSSIYQTIIKASVNNVDLDHKSFEAFTSQEYHTCYRFMNSSSLKLPTDTLTIYLYADASQLKNDSNVLYSSTTYSGSVVEDKSCGLLLFFTDAGQYPGDDADQIMASCGMHTKISVSMISNVMVSSTTNPCRGQARNVTLASHIPDRENDTYNLDRSLCEAYEWALEYHGECGCVPLRFPIPAHVKANTWRCLNVTRWSVDESIRNIRCMSRVQFDLGLHQKIESRCRGIDPCERVTYNSRSSSALWPTASLASTFVDKVLNKTFFKRSRDSRPVPAWDNVLNAGSEDMKMRMIRENIAKVDIRPKSKRASKISESEAYPAMNLFSDVGGILGLYLGMSLLSLLELLESIIFAANVSRKVGSFEKRRNDVTDEPQSAP